MGIRSSKSKIQAFTDINSELKPDGITVSDFSLDSGHASSKVAAVRLYLNEELHGGPLTLLLREMGLVGFVSLYHNAAESRVDIVFTVVKIASTDTFTYETDLRFRIPACSIRFVDILDPLKTRSILYVKIGTWIDAIINPPKQPEFIIALPDRASLFEPTPVHTPVDAKRINVSTRVSVSTL